MRALWWSCAGLLVVAVPAQAYVGPGVGITMVGWMVASVAVLATALTAALRWPVQKFLEWRRGRAASRTAPVPPEAGSKNGSSGPG